MIVMNEKINEIIQKKYDELLTLQNKFVEAGMEKKVDYKYVTDELKKVAREHTTANLFEDDERKEFYARINDAVKAVMGENFDLGD